MSVKEVNSISFPSPGGGFVYVFYFGDTPFYVGEADCFQTRMTDYRRKQFSCQTDFNVGEAAEYFNTKKYSVTVRYWPSEDRYNEERQTIEDLCSQECRLLNGEFGYDYRVPKDQREASIQRQRQKVQEFCETLIAKRSRKAAVSGN
jgi:hypothetical protein